MANHDGEREALVERAWSIYERTLDRLEVVLAAIEKEKATGEHVAPLVGVLRGTELVMKGLEKHRSKAGDDVRDTLAALVKEWDAVRLSPEAAASVDRPPDVRSGPRPDGLPEVGRSAEGGADGKRADA